MRLYFIIILGLLITFSASASEVLKVGSLQAYSNGSNVVLTWITSDESNVSRFEIERRTGVEGEFVFIGNQDPKGPSDYGFTDYTTFRKTTTIYQYRLKIIFSNGQNPIYSDPCTVDHTVSGVRRTWGSIKAMFR
jgi:hypothetical protein